MQRHLRRWTLATCAVALVGCAAAVEPDNAGVDTSSTFGRIQSQVFARNCTASQCHNTNVAAGGLMLEGATAYEQLVGKAADNSVASSEGLMRVNPGEPDQSFLYMKLSGDLGAGMGHSMPPVGVSLDADTMALIRAWISAGAPKTGRVPGDNGQAVGNVVADTSGGTSLPPPTRGVQISVTAPPIPAGQNEDTTCHYLKLPSDVDLDVDRIQIAVSGGSHHVHLYRPFDPTFTHADGVEECNRAVDFDTWELVFASQVPRTDWELPHGVAYHFRAGEQLLVQTHFVNVGGLTTQGQGVAVMNLNAAAPNTVTAYAGSIFGQDRDVSVPPHQETTQSADCVFPNGLTLMAVTGHYHFRGREFMADRLDASGNVGPRIYQFQGYDDPPFQTYDAASSPHFAAGEGIRWTCDWVNNTDQTLTFGPFTDTNEHCNLFGFYYPAQSANEATYCVRDHGVSTTTVRSGGR